VRRSIPIALFLLVACSPSGPNPGDDGDDGVDVPDAGGNPSGPDAMPPPPADLARVGLVIVVGDSIAAGYNAAGGNGSSGNGYARQIVDRVKTLSPDAQFRDLADSGANSTDARSAVQGAVGGLPLVAGDTLILINVGGNDFNDEIAVMLDPSLAAERAAVLRTNLADIAMRLRGKFERPSEGWHALFVLDTIHDPTDDLGTIPAQFDEGFCGTIQNPLFTPELRMTALANLALFNQSIADEAAAQSAYLYDMHGHYIGHGMNGGAARWMSEDCAHPTTEGHTQMRDAIWTLLGG
jgi:lysophospholipase L1-like esterase